MESNKSRVYSDAHGREVEVIKHDWYVYMQSGRSGVVNAVHSSADHLKLLLRLLAPIHK